MNKKSQIAQEYGLLPADAQQQLSAWSKESTLAFNNDKTKVMILSTPQMSRVHHLDEYDPNIAVSGYKLERIKSCKLLGVHINEHLKWDDHIKHTVSGCYATLSILRKLKYLAKYELRKQLAETLILSKLDYADLVFYPLPQFLLRRLQRVQFAAASFVLGHYVKNFRDVLKIGWLPINERRDLNLLKSCLKDYRTFLRLSRNFLCNRVQSVNDISNKSYMNCGNELKMKE